MFIHNLGPGLSFPRDPLTDLYKPLRPGHPETLLRLHLQKFLPNSYTLSYQSENRRMIISLCCAFIHSHVHSCWQIIQRLLQSLKTYFISFLKHMVGKNRKCISNFFFLSLRFNLFFLAHMLVVRRCSIFGSHFSINTLNSNNRYVSHRLQFLEIYRIWKRKENKMVLNRKWFLNNGHRHQSRASKNKRIIHS